MKVSRIDMAGFRGIRKMVSIPCPPGFLVVCGRNGSGKSTICDAVEFCMTGTIRESAHKEKGETIADYTWWRGSGATPERFVSVTFIDDDGIAWVVRRTPEGLDKGSDQVLEKLYRRGESPVSPVGGLCRTSIIRDEEITSLSVDLPEADRYKFVRDALGSVDLSEIEGRIERIRNTIESKLSKEEVNYLSCRDRVADVTARLSDAKAALASQVESHDAEKLIRHLLGLQEADIENLLARAQQSVTQRRLQIDSLHRLLDAIQEHTETGAEGQAGLLEETLKQLDADLSGQEFQLTEQKMECERSALSLEMMRAEEPERSERAELLHHGERLNLTSDSRCPLCGSVVSASDFNAHIIASRAELVSHASKVIDVVKQHNSSLQKRDQMLLQLERLRKNRSDVAAKIKALDEKKGRIAVLAARSGIAISDINTLDPDFVRKELEHGRGRLQQLEQAVAWLDASRATEAVQSLESDLQQSKLRADESFAAKTKMENAIAKCKKAAKGIRSLLGEMIDERLSELSPLIEELYKRLRPHLDWTSINYRLRGDVRRMLSFEVGEGLNPSFVFSSGQRRAAGIAFLLAVHLSRPWCEWKSLLLDDPVQHVDDFRALNLTEVLAAIRKTGRQVICCVEDEALAQLLCRRLRSGEEGDGGLVEMKYDAEYGVSLSKYSTVGPLRSELLIRA